MDRLAFRPQVESLEEKNAPTPLVITPPQGSAVPAAAVVADQGCDNGITPHANEASGGVVSCG